jgi:uncharacterized membrane protein
MAEEVKKEEKKEDGKKMFSAFLKIIVGILLLALGVGAIIRWMVPLKIVIKGCIGLFLILAGVITLAIAKE